MKVTDSTAKLRFTIPRQSVMTDMLKTGWSLEVYRMGYNTNMVACYTIEEYNKTTQQASFFIDDSVRNAPKGYYMATLKNDCCKVGSVLLHVDCNKAIDLAVQDFVYDPCNTSCAASTPKPADCPQPVCASPVMPEPCPSAAGPCCQPETEASC